MRKAAALLCLPMIACGDPEETPATELTQEVDAPQVQTAELTGLYEGVGAGGLHDRLCMVSQDPSFGLFGIVTEGANGAACSGVGEVSRQEDVLRLEMGGDEACSIEARIVGTQVTFPATLPQGCAYYCGTGASLAGLGFEKTGDTVESAMQATDLVGDPLCG